ncbi:nitrate- and nitrite sensing domain-containing protein [Streptomyces sp. NBC_01551]|uniref:sensor histidine kinase n=1 Tax=Streptomyces sp. NBC_01551 TaxID=2975876 RepID=UPI002253735D|nr:nitrate- and nitrite sensing domain-containing protein [Streptomyces sp. NBC_01551]MCX4529347.1 nitrate- and nitrite sensing domain-containing protein [Streptomyces sp. NBC_01551]
MRTPRRKPEAAAPRLPAPPARGRRAHAGPPAEEPADDREASHPAPAGASDGRPPRPRLRLRPRTVRAKIVSLLMVPVVSLLALWGFATVSTAQDISRLSRVQRADEQIRTPLAAAVTELQAERRAAVRLLADPAADPAAALEQQAGRTDAAVRRLRLGDSHTVADSGDYPAEVGVRLDAFVAAAEALGSARKDITGRRLSPSAAYEVYGKVVDAAFVVDGALTGGRHAELGPDARILLEFAQARELLAREDALLAFPGPRNAETLRRLSGAVEARRALTAAATGDLPAAQHDTWQSVAKSAAYADLTGAEDKALAVGTGRDSATAPAGWDAAYTGIAASMREIDGAVRAAAADRADPFSEGALSPAGAAVLLGLAAVAASLVISVRIGRTLVVELVSLRNTALAIAHRKLPDAMERLRAGQDIDVDAETPPGPPAEDEVTQVGQALSTVHRAALGAAVERAELASGVSGVFVNLARRSQVLVHKQLTLLDSMERRADDPGELGDLFRLDHLTTRMRRHAESLIILSGAAPGRAWRTPIPLTNVVRAAVSEIEDYPRVEVRQLAEAAVAGAAVADLTHLLAELIENATQFSPPHTKVRVSGEPVGAGYVLEVEDRGLGMGRETLDDANRRIEQSEALDLFDSDRLGLFVVSRLSARHGVKVHLRTSPYGGTTAVVLLPNSLLQGAITAGPAEPARTAHDARMAPEARTAPVRRPAPRPAPHSEPQPQPRPEPRPGPERPARAIRQPAISVVREDARAIQPAAPAAPAASAPTPGQAARSPEPEDPRPAPVAPLRPRGPGGTVTRTQAAPAAAPAAPVSTSSPNGTAHPAAPVADLPRRVRQASLVPQLREAPAPTEPAGARGPEDPPGRSPEQARDRMAAYRAGWARGSQENSPHAGSEGEQR